MACEAGRATTGAVGRGFQASTGGRVARVRVGGSEGAVPVGGRVAQALADGDHSQAPFLGSTDHVAGEALDGGLVDVVGQDDVAVARVGQLLGDDGLGGGNVVGNVPPVWESVQSLASTINGQGWGKV